MMIIVIILDDVVIIGILITYPHSAGVEGRGRLLLHGNN